MGEARRELVLAARELFAAQGFHATSTRDIARRAGVSESLIFRRFGTKLNLFHEAILEPFGEFVASFMAEWQAQVDAPIGNETIMRRFTAALYDALSSQREVVIALLAANAFETRELLNPTGGTPLLSGEVAQLESAVVKERDVRGFRDLDYALVVRCTVAMIVGMAILDDWFLPQGEDHPGRDRVVEVISTLILHGITEQTP